MRDDDTAQGVELRALLGRLDVAGRELGLASDEDDLAVVDAVGIGVRTDLRGGAERLERVLRFGGLIEQDDGDPFGSARDLEFFYPR